MPKRSYAPEITVNTQKIFEKPFWTAAEAGLIMNLDEQTIRRKCNSGEIPYVNFFGKLAVSRDLLLEKYGLMYENGRAVPLKKEKEVKYENHTEES